MHDRHTRAMRPHKRRMHVEILAETRDALDRYAGLAGVELGRAVDEMIGRAVEHGQDATRHGELHKDTWAKGFSAGFEAGRRAATWTK
jgi:hypothetical protein